jgi:hypothetical protein
MVYSYFEDLISLAPHDKAVGSAIVRRRPNVLHPCAVSGLKHP